MSSILRIGALMTLLAIVTAIPATRASAGTPEEAQLGGLIHSILNAYVIGEFGGRTRANPHYNQRPVCGPSDYDDLREAAKDNATLVAFHARCRLVETKVERLHVHGFAYLPPGYCEPLKEAIQAMLAEHVYSVPKSQPLENISLKHKEISIEPYGSWYFARSSELVATCLDDGSLRLTGRRNRDLARLAAEDASTAPVSSIIAASLFSPIAIGLAGIIGVSLSKWVLVLIAAATAALITHLFYFAHVLVVFPGSFGGRWPLYMVATFGAYLLWAAFFFAAKEYVRRKARSS